MNERFEKGARLTDEMMGPAFTAALSAAASSGGFGADMARLAMEQAFGDTWQRPGLDRKSRSIVTISALIGRGQLPELRNHLRFGLNNGLSASEIEEIILQCQPYVGFPAAGGALAVAIEVLRERGLVPGVDTAEEAGLV